MLFLASSDLTDEDVKAFASIIDRRHGPAKVIPVKGNPRSLIVKTTNAIAPLLRGEGAGFRLGDKSLVSVLTSGAIGNLKRRATRAAPNGEIPQR